MRHLIVLICFLTSSLYATTQLTSEVYKLDFGDQMDEEVLVYLKSGHVVKLPGIELKLIDKLHQGIKNHQLFSLYIDDEKRIINIIKKKSTKRNIPNSKTQFSLSEAYRPSILGSMTLAKSYFYESLPSSKESQCFNRAQVWTHEWRIKHNFYSNKIWLFFTRKYIRQFNFEWWFHVSPYIHVVEDEKVRERVMDIKYSRGPVKIKQWTDIFMRDKAPCPFVEKYSDQANFPETGSCFIMKSPMYYYQPMDLEWKEAFGLEKNTWIAAEIIEAYREAFSIELKENLQ